MIAMTGTDFHHAPLDVRSVFSFTKEELKKFLKMLTGKSPEGAGLQSSENKEACSGGPDFSGLRKLQIRGAVILSTCNRMEVWVSCGAGSPGEAGEILLRAICGFRNVSPEAHRNHFFCLEEEEAVGHLFRLACGLESAILAEDQILTQVGDARTFSHECGTTDGVMEMLFQEAVTAAKRVKTNVAFTRANESAISQAVSRLKKNGFDFSGSRCLVIGNGAYGRLAAGTLFRAGADVTVTVRRYHRGRVEIPEGCHSIAYEDRLDFLESCDLVVSATASPHYTLKYEELKILSEAWKPEKKIVVIDLAVPPDIDPKITKLPFFELTNIDDYSTGTIGQNFEAWEKAEQILAEEETRFYYLLRGREAAPKIQKIEDQAQQNMHFRIQKIIQKLPVTEGQKLSLASEVDAAARRTVNKLIFDLQDYVDEETFRKCVDGMAKVFESR